MTFNTFGNYIKRLGIIWVVILLCLFVAGALQSFNSWQSTGGNGIINSTYCFDSFGMFRNIFESPPLLSSFIFIALAIASLVVLLVIFIFFAFVVASYCNFAFLAFVVCFNAIFALARKTVLSGAVYIELRKCFDLFAFVAAFCYDWFSHNVLSLQKNVLVRAGCWHIPAVGLFNYTSVKRNCKVLFLVLFLVGTSFGVPVRSSQTNFNTGQTTPLLESRFDLKKLKSGCRTLENFFVWVEGPATRRPGTKYITNSPPSEAIILISEEVYPLFVGRYSHPAGNYNTLSKVNVDGTFDTDWGTNGHWQSTTLSSGCHGLAQLSDGSFIVGHLTVDFGDGNMNVTKLDSDGVVDTSWGTNGHYNTVEGNWPITIIVDNSDNAYIGGYRGDFVGTGSIIKLDSNGAELWVKQWVDATRIYPMAAFGFALNDAEDVLYVACSATYHVAKAEIYNCLAVNAVDGSLHTSFGVDGYYIPGSPWSDFSSMHAYNIRVTSDGKLFLNHPQQLFGAVYYSILKLTSAGVLDTTWGTSGRAGVDRTVTSTSKYSWNNTMDIDENDLLFVISYDANGIGYDRSKQYLDMWDTDGTKTQLKYISGLGDEPIKAIIAWRGRVYCAGSDVELDSVTAPVHVYDFTGTFIDSFPVNDLGDEDITQFSIETPVRWENPAVRLIPFEHSTDDNYVLEVGNQYFRFYRTIP